MYKRILIVFLSFSLLCHGYSQSGISKTDLSQVKIDQLSDEEISRYEQQFQRAGLSQEEGYQLLLSRGLPQVELEKLKLRLQDSKAPAISESRTSNPGKENLIPKPAVESKEAKTALQVFGADLFTSHSLSFEPDLAIATPVNYVLGVNDGLQVVVYGVQEVNFKVQVSPEGNIYIPNVGQIQVAGETVESATSLIRQRMSATAYPTLKSGASRLAVNLSKIKSIRVTVIGGFKPGTYTVSSLSTVFNALYYAGGPALNGSYREIELLRNNQLIRKIDLYKFLLKGDQSDNLHLQDNDIIRIPVYQTRVVITGEVKRPGIFEILPGEHLNDLISFASGFNDSAFRASIQVVQLTEVERKVKDVPVTDFAVYTPQPGDQFTVSKILDRYQNRVRVEGAVFRPGTYELTPDLTIGQLIKKAYGLREDAYTTRAQLVRLQDDLTEMMIPVDISAILHGEKQADILLKREDLLRISSINDLRDSFTVTIQGEIRKPGVYRYVDNLSLKDVILQAGGFTDAALPQTIEIGRIIKRNTLGPADIKVSDVIEVSNGDDFRLQAKNLGLKPYDVITIRRKPGYELVGTASVTGQIQFPGPYVIQKRDERVSTLLQRAGGFAPYAYAEGAYLKRQKPQTVTSQIKAAQAEKIEKGLKDSSGQVVASVTRPYDQIPLDLKRIQAYPGGPEDLILQNGDELFIPKEDAQVHITGEVLSPTQLPYYAGYSIQDYIRAAGGFSDDARKAKLYVLHANGKAETARHFLFFKKNPTVEPGSEIVVPKRRERKGLSTGEIIGMGSILVSLAGVIIALFR
jgi:protein involved in polysaccharide export with SLBB domain